MGSRNWCFTLNNYTDDDLQWVSTYGYSYCIFAKEVGESGTPHLQGYMEFPSVKLLTTLHNAHPRVHWEMRKGTQEQAIAYCRYDDYPKCIVENTVVEEIGEKKHQGNRTDLIAVAHAVVKKNFVSTEFPEEYIKYHKGIEAFKSSLYAHRTESPIVVWRWGLAGTGKTREPYDKHIDSVYIKDSTMWWDGYEQQEAIIIDDFDGHWPYRDLLRLLDRYPYQGQYKGGYHKINSKYIYITCEHHPSHFWGGNELEQITRRLTDIMEVKTSKVTSKVGVILTPLPKICLV